MGNNLVTKNYVNGDTTTNTNVYTNRYISSYSSGSSASGTTAASLYLKKVQDIEGKNVSNNNFELNLVISCCDCLCRTFTMAKRSKTSN